MAYNTDPGIEKAIKDFEQRLRRVEHWITDVVEMYNNLDRTARRTRNLPEVPSFYRRSGQS